MELTPQSTVADVQQALDELEDPKHRAVNEKHGDDFGVNLGKLRALAKALKSNQELANELWATGDTATRLVALLIAKPRSFSLDQLQAWSKDATTPKVQAWFLSYIVKKSKLLEELRVLLMDESDPVQQAAAWELTAHQVVKAPEQLNLEQLLDTIESEMRTAPDRLQWAMNTTLAQIGIEHERLRPRALAIGESLQVLADYPTSAGCISPFAPIWITEMAKRKA
ncbi:DNA alkylation repair protein [Glutamicibacter sp. ZJUTW]|uniref:DNA alkylation repair protein n=1 Tax=Glutamicibacter sp. ZJUTW TaxID=1155384 RepID=UPI0011F0FCF5|nr:DNA alkylation repair protein [Glutamicibacter sp. ZJUTW]QEP07370.1 DNA alkylation repair protein [Glutamicibacter sp. ZJUTW]